MAMPDSCHPKFRSPCGVCGKCCTYTVILTRKDIQKIVKLGFKEEEFVIRPFRKAEIRRMPIQGGASEKCYFLRVDENGRNRCAIYESRPNPCIIYPSKDKDITRCPHFERGYLLKDSESTSYGCKNILR